MSHISAKSGSKTLNHTNISLKSNSMNDNDMDEKRKRRLERNRESARECRKRKKEKLLQLKQSIAKLETDNLQLRLKLQIGPESDKQQQDEAAQHFSKLGVMISDGASDNDIRKTVDDIQEKYADYGRDKRSAVSFHISQIHRCLQPTQTTRAILWLLEHFPTFYDSDGSFKLTPGQQLIDEVSSLFLDLHKTLNPTMEQCKNLVQLALMPLNPLETKSSSSQSIDMNKDLTDSELMLQRLDELMSEKNKSLDNEMSEVQNILSGSQIAKFLLWIHNNPSVMQMLEALWPHLTADIDRPIE